MNNYRKQCSQDVVVGSGIGFAGLCAKGVVAPGCLVSSSVYRPRKITVIDAESGFYRDTEFPTYGIGGKSTVWGGVLARPVATDPSVRRSLQNYFAFAGDRALSHPVASAVLANELNPRPISDNIYVRKFLMTNPRHIKRGIRRACKGVRMVADEVESIEIGGPMGSGGELRTVGGKTIPFRNLALCAGVIDSYAILARSGLIPQTEHCILSDSLFGRIGRICFGRDVPYGLFHHHLISKSIRFKSGFEIADDSFGYKALFFLQPAFKKIPASDILMLKEFLRLKSNPSARQFFELGKNVRFLAQVLASELYPFSSTDTFDVYCVLDLGRRSVGANVLCDPSAPISLECNGLVASLKKMYVQLINFLQSIEHVDLVDHEVGQPLTDNFDSAFHLSGSLAHAGVVERDNSALVWSLKGKTSVLVNDNSVVADKGVGNPSLQLF